MKQAAKQMAILVLGWAFILIGLAGLVLPVIPGLVFVLVGISILSTEYVWAHNLMARIKVRFPRLNNAFEEASRKAAGWRTRIFSRGAEKKRSAVPTGAQQ